MSSGVEGVGEQCVCMVVLVCVWLGSYVTVVVCKWCVVTSGVCVCSVSVSVVCVLVVCV